MLFDDFMAQRTGFVYPNTKVSYDREMDLIRRRFAGAEVFVLDPTALAMALNVVFGKPSSVLAALPFVRLPFPKTFIEWSTQDARAATADLGSPNRQREGATTQLERVGFLFSEDPERPGVLLAEYVCRQVDPRSRRTITDLSGQRASILIPQEDPRTLTERWRALGEKEEEDEPRRSREKVRIDDDIRGKARDHYRLVLENQAEAEALMELHGRARLHRHPEMERLRRSMELLMGAAQMEQYEQGQRREVRQMLDYALAALILLNTRNAVETEKVPAPEKLNRIRMKKKQLPLVGHQIVKLKLTRTQLERIRAGGSGMDRSIRGTLVLGHFKVRQTGIFWWNAHARRGYGAVSNRYQVGA